MDQFLVSTPGSFSTKPPQWNEEYKNQFNRKFNRNIGSEAFSGIFRNAMFLQIDGVVRLCEKRFIHTWESAIDNVDFNHKFIPFESLETMLKADPQELPLATVSPLQKLQIILSWARGLLYDGPLDQEFIKKIHDLVSAHCPAKSGYRKDLLRFYVAFPDSYQLVVPASLYFDGCDVDKGKIIKLQNGISSYKNYTAFDVRSIIDLIIGIIDQ